MKKTYCGMPVSYWNTLEKMFKPAPDVGGVKMQTVAEYIESHPEVKTERRISKKGVELVKVYYHTGAVKEYPVDHIHTTTAFDI